MSTRRPVVFLASLLVALVVLRCNGRINPDREFSSQQLQAIVDESLKNEEGILGTIVRVDREGRETFEAASGFIDASRTRRLTADTSFLIGSITKTFTAVLVLQLVEQGTVRLDDPLIEHLSSEWSTILREIEHGDEMTIEQALRHRTGLADVTNTDEFWESLVHDPGRRWKPIDVLRRVREEGKAKFAPGRDFDYNNTNYVLLGALLENVSGRPYRDMLQANILDAIGLKRTFSLEDTLGSCDVPVARGSRTIDGLPRDGSDVGVDWAMAAGSIVSNAADLSRFARALRGGDLFEARDTYQRMCERGPNDAYGLGLEVVDNPDIGRYYGHKGSFLNTRAIVAYFPEEQTTITVCHTYDGFSMTAPEQLMKTVILRIQGRTPAKESSAVVLEGPDLLADRSNVRVNDDRPALGEWDFDPKEEWRLDRVGDEPLVGPVILAAGDDGSTFLLNGSALVYELDTDGNLVRSFDEPGDDMRLGFPRDLFVGRGAIHALYMGETSDTFISWDRNGGHPRAHDVAPGISPRAFVDADRYLVVHSSADPLKRPENELLELASLTDEERTVLTKFAAEEKLLLTTILPRGRFILLEDDVELFPRLILRISGNTTFLGRSDRYLIKKIDLSGHEQIAFSVRREPRTLPADYVSRRADQTRIAGKPMPEEARARFVAEFPRQQTFFTRIASDAQGLVYVFVPDVLDPTRQQIDIFSPEGAYLYRSVVDFAGLRPVSPLLMDGDRLTVVLRSEQGGLKVLQYGIRRPPFSVGVAN